MAEFTARAHKQGKISEWAVIYYEKDGREDQYTVVTGHKGRLKDRSIIRGTENQCLSYYKL